MTKDINNLEEFCEKIIDAYRDRKPIDSKKLGSILQTLDDIYDKGLTTPLTDQQYDTLHQIYNDITGNVIIGGEGNKEKVKHDYPYLKGTLRKVHYITNTEKANDPRAVEGHKVLYDWIVSTYKKLNKARPSRSWKLGFWPKYDGLSMILSLDKNHKCTKAITRGQEDIGVDKTRVFKHFYFDNVIPYEYAGKPIGLKTEVILTHDAYKIYNSKYGNNGFVDARSAAVSIINSDVLTNFHIEFLTIKPLMLCVGNQLISYDDSECEYGPSLIIETSKNGIVEEDEIIDAISQMKNIIDNLSVNCDGVVIRWYEPEAIEILGRDINLYVNNFEIAYKFPPISHYTILKDIKQDIGLHGKVSFTAEFEPIEIKGRIVKNASLGSEYRARELNLAKEDMVNIKYEIIPYLCIDHKCLENKGGNKPIPIITHCPYCNSELIRNPEYMCDNPECPSRIQGKIYTFISRLGISQIGEGIVEILYHTGLVTSIYDLFTLKDKKQSFLDVDGLGKIMYKNITKQIENLEVEEYRLLAAISIGGLAISKSKALIDKYYLKEIMNRSVNDKDSFIKELCELKGISEKTAVKIVEGVLNNIELLTFLLTKIKLKKYKRKQKGLIVFTGFRNQEFETYLIHLGYEVSNSVVKSTSYLIAENPKPDKPGVKLKKALELKIPILSIPEAYELFEYKK